MAAVHFTTDGAAPLCSVRSRGGTPQVTFNHEAVTCTRCRGSVRTQSTALALARSSRPEAGGALIALDARYQVLEWARKNAEHQARSAELASRQLAELERALAAARASAPAPTDP